MTLPDDCRLLPQHVRRRGEGPARPPTAGWRGQLRHRDGETQTRIPRPADQPVQRVNAQKSEGSHYCPSVPGIKF